MNRPLNFEERSISDGFISVGSSIGLLVTPADGYVALATLSDNLTGDIVAGFENVDVTGADTEFAAPPAGSYTLDIEIALTSATTVTATVAPPLPLEEQSISFDGAPGDNARASFRFATE